MMYGHRPIGDRVYGEATRPATKQPATAEHVEKDQAAELEPMNDPKKEEESKL